MTGQVALGHELLVCLDHDAARDTELRGERARRRQRRIGLQAAGADGCPELLLELSVERPGAVVAERDEQLTGPELLHGTGSYIRTR